MPCTETPRNRLIHSRRQRNFERTPRELQCSHRAPTSTTGSRRPPCVDELSVLAKNARTKRYDRKQTKMSRTHVDIHIRLYMYVYMYIQPYVVTQALRYPRQTMVRLIPRRIALIFSLMGLGSPIARRLPSKFVGSRFHPLIDGVRRREVPLK